MAPRASKLCGASSRAPTVQSRTTPSQDPDTTKSDRRADPTADTQRGIGPGTSSPSFWTAAPQPWARLIVTTGFLRRVDHRLNPPSSPPDTNRSRSTTRTASTEPPNPESCGARKTKCVSSRIFQTRAHRSRPPDNGLSSKPQSNEDTAELWPNSVST